ncbi:MFS transporter [Streptomyces sp. SID3343]|uniref:MFS transporter n=1 Tax=Streptomyces sp. SID3343 TaxID=2690260 RepID=UPI001367F515|nr:MFS transporter [Streptomyces sp. SID3343]MYV99790.1 MFS transporter [Streptomyces sp. SID3343]
MTPAIRRLMIGRTFAALATALIPTTLTLAVVHTGAATDLGLVLSCELLPMLLLLPVAGVVADRFPPQRIVLVADLVRAAAQLAIGAELLAGAVRIPDLAVLSAITGVAVAFGTPVVRTLVVALVPEAQRLRINARLGVAVGLAGMAAPAAAGGLMLVVGAGWSSLLTGVLFVASATTLGGLRQEPGARVEPIEHAEHAELAKPVTPTEPTEPTEPPTDPMPATKKDFLGELRAGWAEARRHPWFLANVFGHGVWHFAAGFLLTLGPLIAVSHLGGNTAWVIIAQVGTVGMLIGVWSAARLPIRRPLFAVAIGASVYAFPLVAFALRLPMPVVAGAYFVAMLGLGVLIPLWETLMQRGIPPESLGRVGSFDALISFAARPLGLAVAAPIAAVVGTTAPLLIGAVLVVAANLLLLLLPSVRELPKPAAEAVRVA